MSNFKNLKKCDYISNYKNYHLLRLEHIIVKISLSTDKKIMFKTLRASPDSFSNEVQMVEIN